MYSMLTVYKSVNFKTVKMMYSVTNYNVNPIARHLMKLEYAYIIFVLPFSIKAPKYALIGDLKDV